MVNVEIKKFPDIGKKRYRAGKKIGNGYRFAFSGYGSYGYSTAFLSQILTENHGLTNGNGLLNGNGLINGSGFVTGFSKTQKRPRKVRFGIWGVSTFTVFVIALSMIVSSFMFISFDKYTPTFIDITDESFVYSFERENGKCYFNFDNLIEDFNVQAFNYSSVMITFDYGTNPNYVIDGRNVTHRIYIIYDGKEIVSSFGQEFDGDNNIDYLGWTNFNRFKINYNTDGKYFWFNENQIYRISDKVSMSVIAKTTDGTVISSQIIGYENGTSINILKFIPIENSSKIDEIITNKFEYSIRSSNDFSFLRIGNLSYENRISFPSLIRQTVNENNDDIKIPGSISQQNALIPLETRKEEERFYDHFIVETKSINKTIIINENSFGYFENSTFISFDDTIDCEFGNEFENVNITFTSTDNETEFIRFEQFVQKTILTKSGDEIPEFSSEYVYIFSAIFCFISIYKLKRRKI